MVHKIAIKRPGEPLQFTEYESQYRIDVKPYISQSDDTYLQFVDLKRTKNRFLCLACDEEGLIKSLPFNFHMLTQSGNHSFLSEVVGTVVFLVYELEDTWEKEIYDFEIRDLSDDDISFIEYMIDEKTQENARRLAKMDPHIHTGNEIILEPIENLEEFLGGVTSSMRKIPSFFIPIDIIGAFSLNKRIEFFTDPAGKQKYVAGVEAESSCPGRMKFYCKDAATAKDFSISHNIAGDKRLSSKETEEYLRKYMLAMFQLGLPPFLYVTKETYNQHFASLE